ncbi:MAG TPA: ATP-binding protein, partial [Microlunatus sp.]
APVVASARSVLLAAGIESRMPSALPPLSDSMSEVMGYVVREAVTNVVRHSRAGVCTIDVLPSAVEVRDDGQGLPAGIRSGSGLVGLRSRVESAGGVLQVGTGTDGGTFVRAELGPLETRPRTHDRAGTAP